MSWHFSRALVEASLAGTCSAGGASAPSSSTPTPAMFFSPGKTTDAFRHSRSGMTCEPLTADRGTALLTWSREDSRARTFPQPERAQALPENEADYGGKWRGLLVKFDRALSGWKTLQCLFPEVLASSSLTLPRWGLMRDGELLERTTQALLTSGTESGFGQNWPSPDARDSQPEGLAAGMRRMEKYSTCGLQTAVILWPTPQAHKTTESGEIVNADGSPWDGVSKPHSATTRKPITTALADAVRMWPPPHGMSKDGRSNGPSGNELGRAVNQSLVPTPRSLDWKDTGTVPPSRMEDPGKDSLGQWVARSEPGGSLNPTWVEWLMGFPTGHTDLQPSETP